MARIIVDKDIAVPMRDGTVLRADVYRPDSPEKLPVLLSRTPYNKSLPGLFLNLDPFRAAAAGYNVVFQDCRGRFASQGTFTCFEDEAADGYDTIEWMARQPWANGTVGTFGPSYNGATQWLAGREPGLTSRASASPMARSANISTIGRAGRFSAMTALPPKRDSPHRRAACLWRPRPGLWRR